jgi:hypothetical protein
VPIAIAHLRSKQFYSDTGGRSSLKPKNAIHAFDGPWTKANPRPIESPSVIMQMLEAAWKS